VIDQNEKTPNSIRSIAKNIWSGLKSYLTDWRNLLGHALLGVVFVVVAVWAPIPLWLKLIIIALLITLNVLRMRNKNKKKEVKEGSAE
jgi:Flp pilus assembly protein TadB